MDGLGALIISPTRELVQKCFNNIKGRSRSTGQQNGGERTFLQKEAMYLLHTPSVILPYF